MPWATHFYEPIRRPDGRQLLTLADARAYILKLGNSDHQAEPWQAAIAVLMMAAEERGPIMHARIGMLRALNQHKPRVFDPSSKEPHWGKWKLKRDE